MLKIRKEIENKTIQKENERKMENIVKAKV